MPGVDPPWQQHSGRRNQIKLTQGIHPAAEEMRIPFDRVGAMRRVSQNRGVQFPQPVHAAAGQRAQRGG